MNMSILDNIFKDETVTEEYFKFCDILLLAFKEENKEDESVLYEKAGFELMKTTKKEWGRHLIEFAQKIDRKNDRLGRFV